MPAPTYPPVLREPIASTAGPSFITNPMPETPPGGNAASIEGGFPPVTMTSELAGGKPPLGQDMNGFLFLLSSHLVFLQAGEPYLFNTDVATALGGYPLGAILGMADGTGLWLNGLANNSADPDSFPPGITGSSSGWYALCGAGTASIVTTGGTHTATGAESKKAVIVISGALTANATINLPQSPQEWLLVNTCTGAFTVNVKAGGGAGVTVAAGGFGSPLGVYSIGDGNLYPSVAPLSIPIDQAPTPSTIAERTNAGYLLATYFNQNSSSSENPSVGAVFVENTGADGFLRKIQLSAFEAQLLLQNIAGTLINSQVPYSVVQQWASTFFTNAALTGVPTAPTAVPGTATTQIATTAFVNQGSTVAVNGSRKNPDGTIDKWGTFAFNSNGGNITVNFPGGNFPNACFNVVVGAPYAPSGLGGAGSYQANLTATPTTASFTYRSTSSSSVAITVPWRAVGN